MDVTSTLLILGLTNHSNMVVDNETLSECLNNEKNRVIGVELPLPEGVAIPIFGVQAAISGKTHRLFVVAVEESGVNRG